MIDDPVDRSQPADRPASGPPDRRPEPCSPGLLRPVGVIGRPLGKGCLSWAWIARPIDPQETVGSMYRRRTDPYRPSSSPTDTRDWFMFRRGSLSARAHLRSDGCRDRSGDGRGLDRRRRGAGSARRRAPAGRPDPRRLDDPRRRRLQGSVVGPDGLAAHGHPRRGDARRNRDHVRHAARLHVARSSGPRHLEPGGGNQTPGPSHRRQRRLGGELLFARRCCWRTATS